MTNKLSSADLAQVINDGAIALRKVAAERDHLREKVAQMERHQMAEKLAKAMHSKGIELEQDVNSLTAHLEKQAELGLLPEIQRAVEMIAPNMSIKLAELTSDENHVGGGSTQLERFLIGEEG